MLECFGFLVFGPLPPKILPWGGRFTFSPSSSRYFTTSKHNQIRSRAQYHSHAIVAARSSACITLSRTRGLEHSRSRMILSSKLDNMACVVMQIPAFSSSNPDSKLGFESQVSVMLIRPVESADPVGMSAGTIVASRVSAPYCRPSAYGRLHCFVARDSPYSPPLVALQLITVQGI